MAAEDLGVETSISMENSPEKSSVDNIFNSMTMMQNETEKNRQELNNVLTQMDSKQSDLHLISSDEKEGDNRSTVLIQ